MKRHAQSGVTLVVSLIMLVVLTLLVVSAIRFGNINLKIAANTQFEAEGAAATQVALERVVAELNAATKVDAVPQQSIDVSTGATTYTVTITKPACILTKNINATKELNAANAADQACYEGTDGEKQIDASGNLTRAPTACKDQQWDVAASLNDASSGTKVDMLQGVAVRVGAEIQCP